MKKEKKDKLKNAGAFFLTLSDRTTAASGLTQMKKLWEVIKKIFVWLGAVFSAIFVVLFMKDCRIKSGNDIGCGDDKTEEINAKAAKKREGAISRISNADARTVCEGYGTVCDTIADGKERFRRRCQRTDN